jgi:hypothetical protein
MGAKMLLPLLQLLTVAGPVSAEEPAAGGTTVVVILADDVDDTLLPLTKVMPNLRELVQQDGITFSNSFVTTAVCCPSRSSIMSGLCACPSARCCHAARVCILAAACLS